MQHNISIITELRGANYIPLCNAYHRPVRIYTSFVDKIFYHASFVVTLDTSIIYEYISNQRISLFITY